MFPLFIGYPFLETWLSSIEPTRPVYAALITETGQPGRFDLHTDQLVIMIAQPELINDLVHYCRLVVEEIQYQAGEPMANDRKQRLEKAEQSWQTVKTWLVDHNLDVKVGVVAVPHNLQMLTGSAHFLI